MYYDYPDLSYVKKILVIKLRHLGDVLLSSPLFSILRQVCPKAAIDAYIYKEAIPMLEGHPDITELIGYDRGWKQVNFFSRILKEAVFLYHLRQKKYDLILNLTEGDRGIVTAFVS